MGELVIAVVGGLIIWFLTSAHKTPEPKQPIDQGGTTPLDRYLAGRQIDGRGGALGSPITPSVAGGTGAENEALRQLAHIFATARSPADLPSYTAVAPLHNTNGLKHGVAPYLSATLPSNRAIVDVKGFTMPIGSGVGAVLFCWTSPVWLWSHIHDQNPNVAYFVTGSDWNFKAAYDFHLHKWLSDAECRPQTDDHTTYSSHPDRLSGKPAYGGYALRSWRARQMRNPDFGTANT